MAPELVQAVERGVVSVSAAAGVATRPVEEQSKALRPGAIGVAPVARRPGSPKLNRRSTGTTHSAGSTEGNKAPP